MKNLLAFLMCVIAIATLVIMVHDSDHAKKFYRTVIEYINQKQAQDKSDEVIVHREPQTERKSSFSGEVLRTSQHKLVIALNQIDFGSDQVDYIRKNLDSIPKGLKLSTVTEALRSISFGSDQVEALSLLKDKIDRNFTDREFEEFIKVFTFSSDIVEATSILHRK